VSLAFFGSFEESVFQQAAPEGTPRRRLADDDVVKHLNADELSGVDQCVGR